MSQICVTDVYHINIDIGDCTLIVISHSDSKGGKIFDRSVLIDAGDINSWPQRTFAIISDIAGRYVNSQDFVFNAIVVTHYDSDHYGGVEDLLIHAQDLITKKKTLQPPLTWLRQTRYYDGPWGASKKYTDRVNTLGPPYLVPQGKGDYYTHIGKEIIWGDGLDTVSGASGISGLVSRHKSAMIAVAKDSSGTALLNIPGLFCLACGKDILNDTSSGLGIFPATSTPTNKSSLILVLVDTVTNKVLEYFGGDCGQDREEKVLSFLQPSAPLQVLKFSHHASHFSTPTDFLFKLKPQYGVISAGSDSTYGLPSWKLLMYLAYWNQSQEMSGSVFKLVSVNYPYDWQQSPVVFQAPDLIVELFQNLQTTASGKNLQILKSLTQTIQAGTTKILTALTGRWNLWEGLDNSYITQDCATANRKMGRKWAQWQTLSFTGNLMTSLPNPKVAKVDINYVLPIALRKHTRYKRKSELPPESPERVQPDRRKKAHLNPTTDLTVSDDPDDSSSTVSLAPFNLRAPVAILGLDPTTTCIISSDPTILGAIILDPTCNFYTFVQALFGSQLVINTPTPGPASQNGAFTLGDPMTGSVVQGDLSTWFQNFGVTNLRIYIGKAASIDASTQLVTINVGDLTLWANILGDSCELTGGMLEATAEYIAAYPEMSLGDYIWDLSTQTGSNTFQLSNVLQLLWGQTSTLLGLFDLQAVLAPVTRITFDPYGVFSTNVVVTLDAQSSNTPIILTNFIEIDNSTTYLTAGKTWNLNDNTGEISESYIFGADLTLSLNNKTITCQAHLDYDGEQFLLIRLSLDSSKLTSFLTLMDHFKTGDYMPNITDAQVTVLLLYDLTIPKMVRSTVEATVSLPAADLGIQNHSTLTIDASCTFPGPILRGAITDSISLEDLMTNNPGQSAQTSASVEFTIDKTTGIYSVMASYDSNAIIIPHVSSAQITEARVNVTSAPSLRAQVQLDLYDPTNPDTSVLGVITLNAGYDTQTGWIFSGFIDTLPLSNLLLILPQSTVVTQLESYLQGLTIQNLTCDYSLKTSACNLAAEVIVGQLTPTNFGLEYNYNYDGNQNDRFHLEITQAGGSINLSDLLSSLTKQAAPQLLGLDNVSIPFGSIDIDYDSLSKTTSVAAISQSQELKIIYMSNGTVTLTRVVLSGVPGFPIGNIPTPFTSIFAYYITYPSAAGGVGYDDLNKMQNSQDVDPNSYSTVMKYVDGLPNRLLSKAAAIFFVPSSDVDAFPPIDLSTLQLHGLADANTSSTVNWTTIQKTFGPLFVNKIGIAQGPPISVAFDATITIGPLQVSLTDFTLQISYSSSTFDISLSLGGLGISFSEGDLTIAGDFAKITPPSNPSYVKEFTGGVVITFADLTITAAGSYAEVYNDPDDPTQGTYSSFFIFGLLDAPLGGPPIAYVTGLSAGFGAGQDLIIPSIDQVTNFPLLGVPPGGVFGGQSDVLQILGSLTTSENSGPWVTLDPNGGKWVAFGINFISFELVQTNALLTVNFGGNDDLEIALLARSVFSLPQNASSDQAFVYTELDLDATLQPSIGLFKFDAVLTKNSFVLDRDCVLTGGFAARSWFGDNPYSGDFVITLGGYHPKYIPPSWYPSVDRLGFNWQYSDHISISGDAYFAITPTCGMGGGGLQFLFQDDHVRASYTAHTDVFVRWHPFYFNADIGVSIEASIHLDCFFFSINKTVELGADINIWGPPIGGTVSAHFGPFGFTVSFGADDPGLSQTIPWAQFASLLPHTTDDQGKTQLKMIKFTAEKGLVQPNGASSTAGNSIWTVRPGQFQFRIETSVPMTQITFPGSVDSVYPKNGTVNPVLNILPTGDMGATSTHVVEILDAAGTPIPNWIVVEQPSPNPLLPTGILQRNLPAAMWGASDSDKSQPPIPLWTGLVLRAGIQTPTNVSPVISLGVFDADDPTELGSGLNMNLPPQSGVGLANSSLNPEVANTTISEAIESSDTTSLRNNLVTLLNNVDGMGSFGMISDLSTLAGKLDTVFPDPPRIMDIDLLQFNINVFSGTVKYELDFDISRQGPADWNIQFTGDAYFEDSGTIAANDIYATSVMTRYVGVQTSQFILLIKNNVTGNKVPITLDLVKDLLNG